MSPRTHRYKYAISDIGTPIFIDDITQENRRDTSYVCAGCGRQLYPVLGDTREHHFRHEKDSECSDYNCYLHEYAKAVLKKRFEEGKTFIVQYYAYQECEKYDTCTIRQGHSWDKCSFHGLYPLDLKKFYDTCTPENGFYEETPEGKKRYVADLKLTNSESNIPPIILEVWVNHECTEEKKNSNVRIIEIKIANEEDAWREIIETADDDTLPIRFYSFKDFVPTNPQYTFKHLKVMRGLIREVIVVDESCCGEGVSFDTKSIYELVISTSNLNTDEYEDILASKLNIGKHQSGLQYKKQSFCKHFRISQRGGKGYLACQFGQHYRQCPCERYSFDADKAHAFLDELRRMDITIWTSEGTEEE